MQASPPADHAAPHKGAARQDLSPDSPGLLLDALRRLPGAGACDIAAQDAIRAINPDAAEQSAATVRRVAMMLRAILDGFGARAVARAKEADFRAMLRYRTLSVLPSAAAGGCPDARRLLRLPGVARRCSRAAREVALLDVHDPVRARMIARALGKPAPDTKTGLVFGDPPPGRSALDQGADGRCPGRPSGEIAPRDAWASIRHRDVPDAPPEPERAPRARRAVPRRLYREGGA